jgi:thioredoxin reductase (NADPH)
MKDIVIIGGGPAGLCAALYAARAGLSVRVLDTQGGGGQVSEAAEIENYLGTGRISGTALAAEMLRAARAAGAEIISAEVEGAMREETGFSVLAGDRVFEGRVLMLANGVQPRRLHVTGERELLGRGVSYCALCDGRFFGGKTVAVVGGGNGALAEALYLSRTSAVVHIVHRRREFRGERALLERLTALPNVVLHTERQVLAIHGENAVSGITLGASDGEGERLSLDGVFIAVGRESQNARFANLFPLDERGFVKTDEDCACGAGLFALGDTRAKGVRQIATAVGDGAIAAEGARKYLEKRNSTCQKDASVLY